MITLVKEGERQVTNCMEFVCRSTDVKPVGQYNGLVIPNGSTLKEIDTDANFVYDESTKSWIGERVQPDWSQNDPSAADYIRNRPMYKETKIKTFDLSENEFYNSKLPGFDLPAVGEKVIVNVDGSDVEYAVKSWAGMGEEVLYIGDNPEGVLSGEAENTWCIFEYEGLCACKSNSILRLPIVETTKIPNDYLDTVPISFTPYESGDNAVSKDRLDSISELAIPASNNGDSDDLTVLMRLTDNSLVARGVREDSQHLEIHSKTLDSQTFEVNSSKGGTLSFVIIDIDTKSTYNVKMQDIYNFGVDSSVGVIINSYSQTVACINDVIFSFTAHPIENNYDKKNLTIKRVWPTVSVSTSG